MRKKRWRIPEETVRRLSLYLRILRFLEKRKIRVVSSERLTRHLHITSAQARKDLAYFGSFGRPGIGYNVPRLRKKIERILGIDRHWKVVLVGVGKLGTALINYPGFRRFGFKVVAVFDNNPAKVGTLVSGLKVLSDRKMEDFIKKHRVRVGIISVPADSAQEVVRRLVDSGIRAIFNFAPRYLAIPENIQIKSVDMAMELENLVYYLKNQ